MKPGSRYLLDILFIIGGAFLVVAAMSFSAPAAGWIAFGVSAGLMVVAVSSAMMARRYGRKAGHSAVAVIALWSLIAALVFAGPALTWLVFADAIGLAAVALADLTAHEVTTETVVHRLEVTAPEGMTRQSAA